MIKPMRQKKKIHVSSADSFIVLFLVNDLLTMTKMIIVIKNTSQLNNYNHFLKILFL